MSLQCFIHDELTRIQADEIVHQFCDQLYTVFESQGHSGGSAGFIISHLKRNDLYTAVLDKDSLILPFQKILHLYSEDFVKINLPIFATVIGFKPLTPLTGEDDEWIDHGEGQYQNKRLSSVFKDKGKPYYLDGYVFNELSNSKETFIGYTGYYSRKEISFPFSPEGVTENLFYTSSVRDVQIKDKETALHYLEVERLNNWAGYLDGTLINPSSFFVQVSDIPEFTDLVNQLFQHLTDFNGEIKESIIGANQYLDDFMDEESKLTQVLKLPNGVTFNHPIKYTMPLKRIIALIPNQVTISDGKLFTLRGSELSLTFHALQIPTKHFITWQPFDDNLRAFSLHWGIDKEPEPVRLDKLGYELRLVDNDNYLYQMRVRFGLRHPKVKKSQPLDINVDQA